MILNLYVWKGSKQSLIGPWIVAGFLVEDVYLIKENEVPHKNSLFKSRKSLNKYNEIVKNNLNIVSIPSSLINTEGEYAIFKAFNKIKSYAYSRAIEKKLKLKINIFTTPTSWYERLTILYAVFIRHQYILRLSQKNINYFLLENNLDAHINLLIKYKYLPPIYIQDKCLNLFKNIYPKPTWWINEINLIK